MAGLFAIMIPLLALVVRQLHVAGKLAPTSMSPSPMKRDRYFYSATSFILLVLMLIGFQRFYFEGKEASGRDIPNAILAPIVIHGVALTMWVVLFFVQSLLIASKNRQLHMKLGWFAAAVALAIAVSGPFVAIAAPRIGPGRHVMGMTYPQFILPMLTEITAFTVFVILGLSFRKRPAIHRSMMLLATLSVISGATSRTHVINQVFGTRGWVGLFGPAFVLGAAIILIRSISTRSFDRWFAAGYTGLVCVYITAMNLAVGDSWSRIAAQIVQR